VAAPGSPWTEEPLRRRLLVAPLHQPCQIPLCTRYGVCQGPIWARHRGRGSTVFLLGSLHSAVAQQKRGDKYSDVNPNAPQAMCLQSFKSEGSLLCIRPQGSGSVYPTMKAVPTSPRMRGDQNAPLSPQEPDFASVGRHSGSLPELSAD